ncbi:MAG: hypothetical protein QM811_02760 [Pirellulales bacterium]
MTGPNPRPGDDDPFLAFVTQQERALPVAQSAGDPDPEPENAALADLRRHVEAQPRRSGFDPSTAALGVGGVIVALYVLKFVIKALVIQSQ